MKNNATAKNAVPENARFTKLRAKPRKVEVNGRETYPKFKTVQVGETFDVKDKTARDMRGAIYGATKRYNRKYISRTIETRSGNVKARIWRVQ